MDSDAECLYECLLLLTAWLALINFFFFHSCVQISGLLKQADQHQTNDRKKNSSFITNGLSFSASTYTLLFCLCLCVRLIQIDVIAHAVCV